MRTVKDILLEKKGYQKMYEQVNSLRDASNNVLNAIVILENQKADKSLIENLKNCIKQIDVEMERVIKGD